MSVKQSYPLDKYTRACDQLKTPVYLLGLGVALLRQYFGEEDRIALEKSQYLWTEDQTTSQLYIGWQDNLDYETIGKRPAVIVSMGEFQFPKEVVNNLMGASFATGAQQFLDHSLGSWTFTCLTDKAAECLGLAAEVKYFFQTYRAFIAPAYAMDSISVSKIGVYEKQKDYKDMYGCPVSVGFSLQDNFEVVPDALRISAIKLRLVPASV